MLLENVKKLCKKHGTTLFALEKKLSIGNGAIAKWDSSDPKIGNVKKVADFFGVSVDELLAPAPEVVE